jgi:hypothetical protein
MNKQMTMTLDEGYKSMASDTLREKEAVEWCEALFTLSDERTKATPSQIMAADLQIPRIITND